MIDKLLRIRHVYLIAVIFTFLNSLVFLIRGMEDSFHGYQFFWKEMTGKEAEKPEIYFVESLDKFLIAFVLLIFSLGITKLFILGKTPVNEKLPGWLNITSFKELKILLWETILVTLVVFTVDTFVENLHHMSWELLILPTTILILSLSLFLMKKD